MRYSQLKFATSIITDQDRIDEILKSEGFHWLIDSEIEMAKIEIKNKTLIWWDGFFYSGDWHYGILKGGKFWGTFHNGIIEGGQFYGKFISGVRE